MPYMTNGKRNYKKKIISNSCVVPSTRGEETQTCKILFGGVSKWLSSSGERSREFLCHI